MNLFSGNRKLHGAKPVLPGSSRPPTLQECESIIKHLQLTNEKQNHEVYAQELASPYFLTTGVILNPSLQLVQIKADLRDVLYSHKWTPDAYLIARAYISDKEEDEEG